MLGKMKGAGRIASTMAVYGPTKDQEAHRQDLGEKFPRTYEMGL